MKRPTWREILEAPTAYTHLCRCTGCLLSPQTFAELDVWLMPDEPDLSSSDNDLRTFALLCLLAERGGMGRGVCRHCGERHTRAGYCVDGGRS